MINRKSYIDILPYVVAFSICLNENEFVTN